MYSGTTFRRGSGRIVGVHQKIDRVARRNLNKFVLKSLKFPGIRNILHFEGKNGPDGLSLKGSATDIPWHFIDPADPNDKALLIMINDHIYNLTEALKYKDNVRASFEAAWLAHAITDGLTPAHHYPLDDKIKELFGKTHNERRTLKDKNIIHGKNRRDTLSKNWEYWGAGGVFTAHLMYEMGVASTIAPEKFSEFSIKKSDIDYLIEVGFDVLYLESVQKIHNLNIYDNFTKSGWTVGLASETRTVLLPEIIRAVTLAWYQAALNVKGIKA
jgi:hypothetical protein